MTQTATTAAATSFTAEQIALRDHIEATNAKFVAEAKANGATAWFTTVSDPAHWAECGIFTIEQYERDRLISYISDVSKDARGYRTRLNWDEYSMEELQAIADDFTEELRMEMKRGEEHAQKCIADFERLVQECINMGAGDRETAIRWIVESHEEMDLSHDDPSYICYYLGLPYRMESEFMFLFQRPAA